MTLRTIPLRATIFDLDEFVEMVNEGAIIDGDGDSYYGYADRYDPYHQALPSQIKDGVVDRQFTCVIWFDK